MKDKIKVGIVGGAGYTGGETIRLLLNHPNVEIVFVQSRSNAGNLVSSVHTDLTGDTVLKFSDTINSDVDVVFLCLGHGESKKFLLDHSISDSVAIIDLSQDFRLGDSVNGRTFVYGLPEVNIQSIKQTKSVANPGCFATAIQLGLLPLAKHGLLKDVYTTGITGSTGAGQKLQDTTHFSWRANNISAYKTLSHQHLGEIHRTLKNVDSSFNGSINFVPWRGDFARGIFVSSIVSTEKPLEELKSIYQEFYSGHPFTHVSDHTIDLKKVVNTNKCVIGLEKEGDTLVVHSAIDNLLKGASGQAVQNMNLMFGFEESTGLKLKSTVF